MKTAVTVRTRKFTDRPGFLPAWKLELVGASGRILGLCMLHRMPHKGGGYYYESDTYSTRRDTLAGWREYATLKMDELAYDFVQAERCAICDDKAADGVDCLAECAARHQNHDSEERIRIRLKG